MNSKTLVQVAGASVGAIVVVVVIGWVSGAIYGPIDGSGSRAAVLTSGEAAVPSASGSGGAAGTPSSPEQLEALMASADAGAAGPAVTRCLACHTFDEGGPNRVGPNLWHVFGKEKASTPGFNYTNGMRKLGGVWTLADLDALLASPRKFVPGTRMMAFPGIADPQMRANVIAYLRAQGTGP